MPIYNIQDGFNLSQFDGVMLDFDLDPHLLQKEQPLWLAYNKEQMPCILINITDTELTLINPDNEHQLTLPIYKDGYYPTLCATIEKARQIPPIWHPRRPVYVPPWLNRRSLQY
ncbi:hypothetical protein JDW15_00220 [Aerococcaceae bacterium zg-ZJ1578]|uniref:hypothetical protein n=1 Tax=Aerococcaceae bacterium zg-252 TaxID=2796928 RepID=UPI001A1C80B0|nr:hypothetical protein [Aerococcaceae bacterium zg-1578]